MDSISLKKRKGHFYFTQTKILRITFKADTKHKANLKKLVNVV